MLTPGNVAKVYKKEVLDNLVGGWNKYGKRVGQNEKRAYDI